MSDSLCSASVSEINHDGGGDCELPESYNKIISEILQSDYDILMDGLISAIAGSENPELMLKTIMVSAIKGHDRICGSKVSDIMRDYYDA